jgi:hypothetical protein
MLRLIRFSVVVLGLTACMSESRPPVSISREVRLGVAFGDPFATVRTKHPTIEFVPYAGWVETVMSGPFETVVYQFGQQIAPTKPDSGGRLSAIHAIARSTTSTDELIQTLDASNGAHRFAGCERPPSSGQRPEEIAVLEWPHAREVLFAEVVMQLGSVGKPQISHPLLLLIAPPGTRKRALNIDDLKSDCFSRLYSFTPG